MKVSLNPLLICASEYVNIESLKKVSSDDMSDMCDVNWDVVRYPMWLESTII